MLGTLVNTIDTSENLKVILLEIVKDEPFLDMPIDSYIIQGLWETCPEVLSPVLKKEQPFTYNSYGKEVDY